MKKILFIISFMILMSGLSFSQQVPQVSQNMFNKLANNPGSAGNSDAINAYVVHRQQWMGFEGSPVTSIFSVDAPVPMLNGGLGLNIITDQVAQFSNLDLQLSYAYQTQLGSGQLGLGAAAGMYQSGLDGTQLNPSQSGDPDIPTGEISGSAIDFGLGLYYNTRDVYIGLSSLHVTEPTIEKTDGKIIELSRHYFLLAGYYHEINPLVSLNPSIYLKSDGATSQLDINTNILYNNKIWGGVSYRLDEGIVFLTGLNINEDLKFGLAYDVVLNKIKNNSVEFMLGYRFKVDYDKPVKSYKNPRYL